MNDLSFTLPDLSEITGEDVLWFNLSPNSQENGFDLGIEHFHLKIDKGTFVESEIRALLKIPRLTDETTTLGVDLSLDQDGDFDVTATFPPGWPQSGGQDVEELDPINGVIGLPSVFLFAMDRLSVGKNDGAIYLETGGALRFDNGLIRTVIKDDLIIKKLRIDTKGHIEVEGGSIPLPRNQEINLGPAKISVTAIHTGKMQRDGLEYSYFGFSGGMSMNPGGVDASGESFKIAYRKTDSGNWDVFFHIEGLHIDIVIPGDATADSAALIINGYLSMKQNYFEGGVSITLPTANIAGGATMKFDTKTPAFLIGAWLELPMPIPLGATNLGIFGFRGTFGKNYIAVKDEGDRWFDWYVDDPRGIEEQKLIGPRDDNFPEGLKNPFTIGAGMSLATVADEGKAFTSQLMLLASIPTLIMLDGRADIMAEKRLGLDSGTPPFWAFVALAPMDQSIETGIGADYKIPKESGAVLDLNASIEAGFFFKDASAWYLNIGRIDRPIRARIISLFDAQSYLMLSAKGVRTGASVTLAFSKSYLGGKIKAHASAYLRIWAAVSFEDWQLGGGIAVGGALDISFFGFGLFATLDTILTAEAWKPFKVAGSLQVCVGVRIFGKKIERCFAVSFVWVGTQTLPYARKAILVDQSDPANPPGASPAMALHRPSGRTYPLTYLAGEVSVAEVPSDVATIPIDCFIDLKFAKPVKIEAGAGTQLGGVNQPPSGFVENVPPSGSSRKVRHEYNADMIELQISNGSDWVRYDPYEAVDPAAPPDLPAGFWQNMGGGYDKVRFLSDTEFSYMVPAALSAPEHRGQMPHDLFCQTAPIKRNCVDWNEQQGLARGCHFNKGLFYRIEGEDGRAFENAAGSKQKFSLAIDPGSSMTGWFDAPARDIRIDLTACAKRVKIHWQRRVWSENADIVEHEPEFEDLSGSPTIVNSAHLHLPIVHSGEGVDRFIIEPIGADDDKIAALDQQIGATYDQLVNAHSAGNDTAIAQLEHKIATLRDQKNRLLAAACSTANDKGAESQTKDKVALQIGKLHNRIEALDAQIAKIEEEYSDGCPVDGFSQRQALHHALQNNGGMTGTLKDRTAIDAVAGTADKLAAKIRKQRIEAFRKLNRKIAKDQLRCQRLEAQLHKVQQQRDQIEKEKAALEASIANPQFQAPLDEDICCEVRVNEICWMDAEAAIANANIPSQTTIDNQLRATVEAITQHVEPVLRPDSLFRLLIKTSDNMSAPGQAPERVEEVKSIVFKTGRPLGFFPAAHIAPSLESNTALDVSDAGVAPSLPELQFPELKLSYYLDKLRSYPDPSGSLLYAKPLYTRGAQIDLMLQKRYAHHFFQHWWEYHGLTAQSYALETEIVDPTLTQADGSSPVSAETQWLADIATLPSKEHTLFQNMQNSVTCNPEPVADLVPAATKAEVTLSDLEPRKTYTAVVYNSDGQERKDILRFPFVSSAYPDFEHHVADHVLRYRLHETRKAFFNMDLQLGVTNAQSAKAIENILSIMEGEPDPATQFSDPFDQVFFEALTDLSQSLPTAIGQNIDPPLGTDITFLREKTTDTLFGVWIRSIEPFNDPRLFASQLDDTIAWIDLISGNEDTGCRKLFSRDRCEILLVNPDGISRDDTALLFRRKIWEDRKLVVSETQQIVVSYDEAINL